MVISQTPTGEKPTPVDAFSALIGRRIPPTLAEFPDNSRRMHVPLLSAVMNKLPGPPLDRSPLDPL
eukprot:5971167-Pyramimonas_sp.AAC.1